MEEKKNLQLKTKKNSSENTSEKTISKKKEGLLDDKDLNEIEDVEKNRQKQLDVEYILLTKALKLLLAREIKHLPIEKKITFLKSKMSESEIEKAVDLYFSLEPEIISKYEEIGDEHKRSFFDTFLNPYILTAVALSGITTNYLFEASRNKKNDLFYNDKIISLEEQTKKVLEETKELYTKGLEKKILKNEVVAKINDEITTQNTERTFSNKRKGIKERLANVREEVEICKEKLNKFEESLSQNREEQKKALTSDLKKLIDKKLDSNVEMIKEIMTKQNELFENLSKAKEKKKRETKSDKEEVNKEETPTHFHNQVITSNASSNIKPYMSSGNRASFESMTNSNTEVTFESKKFEETHDIQEQNNLELEKSSSSDPLNPQETADKITFLVTNLLNSQNNEKEKKECLNYLYWQICTIMEEYQKDKESFGIAKIVPTDRNSLKGFEGNLALSELLNVLGFQYSLEEKSYHCTYPKINAMFMFIQVLKRMNLIDS